MLSFSSSSGHCLSILLLMAAGTAFAHSTWLPQPAHAGAPRSTNHWPRSLQYTYEQSSKSDYNTVTFHWTKPEPAHNGVSCNKAFTNYVLIALCRPDGSEDSIDLAGHTNRDYSTSYIFDLPIPFQDGTGSLDAKSKIVRTLPAHCSVSAPANDREFYVLKAGSYLANPNDTTAVLTNAIRGKCYLITRFDYLADASGRPTNIDPSVYPTFYPSQVLAVTIPLPEATQVVALDTTVSQATNLAPLTLSPNPAHSHSLVHLLGSDPSQPVELLNSVGQLVREYPAGTQEIRLPQQAPGIYVVRQGIRRARLILH